MCFYFKFGVCITFTAKWIFRCHLNMLLKKTMELKVFCRELISLNIQSHHAQMASVLKKLCCYIKIHYLKTWVIKQD